MRKHTGGLLRRFLLLTVLLVGHRRTACGEYGTVNEYAASLVLLADKSVVDPGKPFSARIARLFAAEPAEGMDIRLHVNLRRAAAPRRAPVKRFRPRNSSRLPDKPDGEAFVLNLDLDGIKAGNYLLAVEVYNGHKPLRRFAHTQTLVAGLDAAEKEFKTRLQKIEGHEAAKASILYPFDYARRIDEGVMSVKGYRFAAGLANARKLLEALEAGEGDRRIGQTGDQRRHYFFEETGHSMGGNGTWLLGAKYAETWTAIAPMSAGGVTPDGVRSGQAEGAAIDEFTTGRTSETYPFDRLNSVPGIDLTRTAGPARGGGGCAGNVCGVAVARDDE